MRACARVVAQADDAGVTRLTGLRSEPPLLLRHTPAAAGAATVHLLGGAAGPLGGDDLRLEIVVGERAQLRVVSHRRVHRAAGPLGRGLPDDRDRAGGSPAASCTGCPSS